MTEQEFKQLVLNKVNYGKPFVLAVYEAMDEAGASRDQGQWACHRGCSFCCHQMVQVTSGEIEVIVRFLKKMPRKIRRAIIKHAWKMVVKYMEWFQSIGGKKNPKAYDQHWVAEQWRGKVCPFLSNDGACSIHPVRPIDCRTLHSITVCQNWSWPDAARMPYEYERWANNLILEHEKKCRGIMAVAPLHHWLKAKENEL